MHTMFTSCVPHLTTSYHTPRMSRHTESPAQVLCASHHTTYSVYLSVELLRDARKVISYHITSHHVYNILGTPLYLSVEQLRDARKIKSHHITSRNHILRTLLYLSMELRRDEREVVVVGRAAPAPPPQVAQVRRGVVPGN